MSEKSETGRELLLDDFEKKFEDHEKSPLWKKFENYQKNLLCVRDVADRLLGHMKGHGVSFKPEIIDGKGKFSQEKLSDFVEELLSRWAAKQREGTFTDSSTGESMAEPYIRARQELYGCYLYLVMRCSLWKGGYDLMTGCSGGEERTDFAFLLEQAKMLLRAWCVMEEPDGSRKNELFWGYDGHFGLHLYRVLSCPAAGYANGFDWPGRMPVDRPAFLTDEGNVKRNQFKSIYISGRPESLAEKAEKAAQPDKEGIAGDGCGDEDGYDMEDSYDDENGYDVEDNYDIEDSYDEEDYDEDIDGAFAQDDWYYSEEHDALWYEEETRQAQKQADIEYLALYFEHQDEYVKKCERFVELFRQAGHDVLRGFCEDLEEIVALYLIERDIPPMMDTDKALDVYSSIYDEALQRARCYERGIQWKTM